MFIHNEDGVFSKVNYFSEDEDIFRNVKQYFKLNNLPDSIEYTSESYHYKMTLIYSDFFVEITNDSWELFKK